MKPIILGYWPAKEIIKDISERDVVVRSGQDNRRDFLRKTILGTGLVTLASGLVIPRSAKAGSVIKSRTYSAVVDNRIQLANSNFARPITGITGWNTLRIGVRLAMNNTAANLSGTPRFSVGFCSGNSNILLDATTTHWVGVRTSIATWRYAVSTMTQYDGTSGGLNLTGSKRVGSTFTDSSASQTLFMQADTSVAQRKLYFIELIHGSPNYTFKSFYCSASSTTDASATDFLTQMGTASPAFANHTYATVSGSLAVSEGTDGTLDNICIAWDQVTPSIEICDVAVARLA